VSSQKSQTDTANIVLGSRLSAPDAKPTTFWTDEAELQAHMHQPWMQAYAEAQFGIATPAVTSAAAGYATVSDWALRRHTCLFGSTGGGKSRLALHLVSEHLRNGGSVVALDPKPHIIAYLLDCCRKAGLSPEQIVVLDPADPSAGIPGWNPLLADLPPAQAATDLYSILKADAEESWGPRLGDIVTNALVFLGTHRLSLFELPRLLKRPKYLSALLRLSPPSGQSNGGAAFSEAHDFFAEEYLAWTQSYREGAIGPVLNKTRKLLSSEFLQPLLCARRNTLDLASLWHKPGVVLVHLDSNALGDDGAQLLGGLLAHQIYRTALRSSGPIPVLLSLDELGAQERFIGGALGKIITVARDQNLRLLAATQHLTSLSSGLREAFLGNAGLQVSFRVGYKDARLLAASYAVGAPESLSHATVGVAERNRVTGRPERTTWRHPVLDARERPLRLSPAAWKLLRHHQATAPLSENSSVEFIHTLLAKAGIPRLYVHAADTKLPTALTKYVQNLSGEEYWFDGPAPLELVVSFPRPKFTHVQRRSAADLTAQWTRTLQQLPGQYAAVRMSGNDTEVVRILDVKVSDGALSDPAWTAAARRAASFSWNQIAEMIAWRKGQIEWISGLREEAVTLPVPTLQSGISGPHPISLLEEALPQLSRRDGDDTGGFPTGGTQGEMTPTLRGDCISTGAPFHQKLNSDEARSGISAVAGMNISHERETDQQTLHAQQTVSEPFIETVELQTNTATGPSATSLPRIDQQANWPHEEVAEDGSIA